MWLKPKEWVHVPFYASEIRKEMRVRECRQTCIAWDHRYKDPDTGKFITDKLPTIHSYSLGDVMVPECRDYYDYSDRYYNSPAFVPKDNDFDEECRRDEEKRKESESKIIEFKVAVAHKYIADQQEIERRRLAELARLAAEKEALAEEEEAYQIQVIETEARLEQERIDKIPYYGITERQKKATITFIMKNSWVPK